MQDQKITILLRAFDHRLLDQAAKEIVSTVERTSVDITGPIPLPMKIEKYTIKKSTHVFKEAQDQFEIRRHKRLLIIEYPNPQTVNALMKVDLACGVDVEIKLGDS